MKRDIEQMEKTIHDYLEFARGEDLSLINRVNIGNLLQTIIFECKTSQTEIISCAQNPLPGSPPLSISNLDEEEPYISKF